jgi:hypothetical protein
VADTGRRLDIVFANAAAIDVARIGEVTQDHLPGLRQIVQTVLEGYADRPALGQRARR